MPTIRLEQQLIEECTEYLKMNGLWIEGMSVAATVRKCLSLLIYGEPSLEDGRTKAAEILFKTGKEPSWQVRGKVAKFFRTYDFEQHEKDSPLPAKVKNALAESAEKVKSAQELVVEDPKVKNPPFKDTHIEPKVLSDEPPWEGVRRVPYDDILNRYPKHRAIEWAGVDPIRILAIETAFAVVPTTLHKQPILMQTVEDVYKVYEHWAREKNYIFPK